MSDSAQPETKARRRIIVGDFDGYARGLTDTLQQRKDWQVFTLSQPEALYSQFKQMGCHVMVLSVGSAPAQALGLLKKIIKEKPGVIRIVLFHQISTAVAAEAAELAHHALPLDATPQELEAGIDHALKVISLVNSKTVRSFVGGIQRLPALPTTYRALTQALERRNANAEKIAEVIVQDPVLTARLMQLVNSSYFAIQREVVDVQQAVSLLGVKTIRDLALSHHLFSTFEVPPQWNSFSFERLYERSLLVGRLAQRICKERGEPRAVQELAFLAGVLHDFGVTLLVQHDAVKYQQALTLAAERQRPVFQAEKALFGVTHAQAGAFLLAFWRLPPKVYEAVLLHHTPRMAEVDSFEPLTAVHIADAMLPSLVKEGTRFHADLDKEYLTRIGEIRNMHKWTMLANEYRLMFRQPK